MAKTDKPGASWQDALSALLPDDYTPQPDDIAETASQKPDAKPLLRIAVDKKRAGKTATIITGFDPGDTRALDICALLKRRLATGGSSRGGEILVQGDRRQAVADILTAEGYKVKQI